MEAEVAIGLDIGTGGARAIAVDHSGTIRGEGSADYDLHTPAPGEAEQAPLDWWQAAQRALRAAYEAAHRPPLAAIGLSGQMHGVVLVDDDIAPLRPALLWCDSRAAEQAAATTRARGRDWLIDTAGNPPLPGFTAPQLRWLREAEDPALARASWVMCAKDYVRAQLTGEVATDHSDASGTGLYSPRIGGWSAELADAYGVDASLLPPVLESGALAGRLTVQSAELTGLPAGTPVAAGAADNAAAALGAGVVRPGQLMISIGTSGTLLAPRSDATADPSGHCHLFRHAVPDTWYSMAVVLSAGGALSWWQRLSGAAMGDLVREAESVPAGSEGASMLPYLSGRRMPRDEPAARAGFAGLTLAHGRGHLTRAVIEGATYGLADGLSCLRDLGIDPERAVLTGGASEYRIWQEALALAIPGLALARGDPPEGAAMGAALLGFAAAGGSLESLVGRIPRVEPLSVLDGQTPEAAAAVAEGYERFRALSDSPLITSGGASTRRSQ